MSKKSRTKGHNFERQVALVMNEEFYRHDLPIKLKRDLAQYQESDRGDLLGLDGFTIECKRYAKGNRPQKAWWKQVVTAAGNTIPLLVYKFDRQPIEVQFPVMLFAVNNDFEDYYNDYQARMDFDAFLYLLICYLKAKHE